MRFPIFVFLLIVSTQSYAQLFFNRHDAVPVAEENGTLDFPWAGGLNHPEFSNMDFDSDGKNDLFVFDKGGDKITCFRMNAQNQLEIAPRYRDMFTNQHGTSNRSLHGWVLLRDFNADGKSDIFTYSNGGMAVYRNDGNADTLIFTLMTRKLLSDYGNGLINIYVSPADLPAIMDVDGDSDMDIVTFSLFGTSAEYHQNQSMELYGIPDSMTMELATPCWGNFQEDPSTVGVNLNVACKGNINAVPTTEADANSGVHSGFTMLGLDIEGDGDQDLVVSVLSFDAMNILINTGDGTTANIGSQDPTFPANFDNTSAINIFTFPAAFLVDVNNDGHDDIVASPNQENNGHNYHSSHLYLNSSSTANFDLDFVKNNFLQDEMIELGTSAYPVFFDYDQDGLKDLIVGNKGYSSSTAVFSSQLAYYRNTGSSTEPAFTLQTRDLANISSLGIGNVAATFGDLDGDGDDDMLVGAVNGTVHYFANSAGAGNPCSFSLTSPGFQGITISGQYATPCLYDVDGDQLLDLIIGGKSGNLVYYHNDGTSTTPLFTLTDSNFGSVDMTVAGSADGYSAPFLFEHEGRLQMLVGSESGRIDLYDEITEVVSDPSEIVANLGSGTSFTSGSETTPYGFSTQSGRNQYLIRASELTAAGLNQGAIQNMILSTENTTTTSFSSFYIKMGLTNLTELNGFVGGTETVYYLQTQNIAQGATTFDFTAQSYGPIVWDGESNLVVEICWYRGPGSTGNDQNVQFSTLPYNCTAYSNSNNTDGCGIEYIGSTMQRPNFIFTVKPSFNKVSAFPAYEGERSAPCLGDLNADGLPELVIGNLAGGLAYYKGDTVGLTISGIEEVGRIERFDLNLYPNPNNGTFTIEPHVALDGIVQIRAFNTMGELVWSGSSNNLIRQTFDLSSLQNGIYLLDIRSENKMATKRFIVQR
ncbi:MAG: T9SS type A sorting domain-containing protein [Flavobacteriales bacterium]|nr:T9SS type A sorting domain-containing protein [Flavobacteriales bacterium]